MSNIECILIKIGLEYQNYSQIQKSWQMFQFIYKEGSKNKFTCIYLYSSIKKNTTNI